MALQPAGSVPGNLYGDGKRPGLGHNFVNHFGRLNQLKVCDKVCFEAAAGQRYVYQVQKMEVLQPTAISKMVQSKYDLSLFTCTYDGTTRFTVRCRLLQIK